MGHLHTQADGVAHVSERVIEIDFSNMPLRRLISVQRLGDGMKAKNGVDWHQASRAAARGIRQYLDPAMKPKVYAKIDDFKIVIDYDDPNVAVDIEAIFAILLRFFSRENIRVEKPSGIRG